MVQDAAAVKYERWLQHLVMYLLIIQILKQKHHGNIHTMLISYKHVTFVCLFFHLKKTLVLFSGDASVSSGTPVRVTFG